LGEEHKAFGINFKPINSFQIRREQKAHHESHHIICPSEFVKKTLVERGINSSKVSIIPYGCSTVSTSLREECHRNPNKETFNVLFVGQVSLRKGFHYLLEAFKNFNHPQKRLIIAGPVLPVSKEVIARYCLDNVQIVGVCTKEQLHHYYSIADVFVLPSLAEGLALVIGEALSYGLPIIFTEQTGARSLITGNVEGLEVNMRSSADICEALERLASDSSLLNTMKYNAWNTAKTIGSWNNYGDQIVSLLDCKR
jgi:glycosyltransferase involved in cell wall biosynthesis